MGQQRGRERVLPIQGLMVRIRGTGVEARIYGIVDGAVTVAHELETHGREIGWIHGHGWWP